MTQKMTVAEFRKSPEKRRTRPRQEEHNHQALFFSVIWMNANIRICPDLEFIFAVPNAGKRSEYEQRIAIAEGLNAGVPDIVIPSQRRGYPGGYLEAKFGKNTLSPEQKKFRDHLQNQGYFFRTCYSAKELLEQVEWFFGIDLIK